MRPVAARCATSPGNYFQIKKEQEPSLDFLRALWALQFVSVQGLPMNQWTVEVGDDDFEGDAQRSQACPCWWISGALVRPYMFRSIAGKTRGKYVAVCSLNQRG
jgi:hypothetical protein